MLNNKFQLIILAVLIFFGLSNITKAQSPLFQKKDSVYATVTGTPGDSISVLTLGGIYEKGAFTASAGSLGDTLKVQVRYYGSNDWVDTGVKNILTQSNVQSIILNANTTVDFEILDPVIVGVRIISTAPYASGRKSFLFYRLRR